MRAERRRCVAQRRQGHFRRDDPARLKSRHGRTWPWSWCHSPIAISDTARHDRRGGRRGGPDRQGGGWSSVLLVPSALHIPRALASFQRRHRPSAVIPGPAFHPASRTARHRSRLDRCYCPAFPMPSASAHDIGGQRADRLLASLARMGLQLNPTERTARANYFLGAGGYQASPLFGGGWDRDRRSACALQQRSPGRLCPRQRMRFRQHLGASAGV